MNIVLIGAGGTGMSAIALILHRLGYDNLVCIDKNKSQIIEKLEEKGIKTIIGHGKYKVDKNDIVIYSDAAYNSTEVQESNKLKQKKGKRYHMNFSYFQFIGEISKYFKTISIAGTHGKTTSTAMMMQVLKEKKDFGLGVLGGLVNDFGGNNYLINQSLQKDLKKIFDHIITGDYNNFSHDLLKKYFFVIEADEFNRHFLQLDTDRAIITNIDFDHSDVYTKKEYIQAFVNFSEKVKKEVYVLKDKDGVDKLPKQKIKKTSIKQIDLNYMFGQHNQENASLVYSLAKDTGLEKSSILKSLKQFKGIWRRLEYLGENDKGAKIYTDYAHHPTEIKNVIKALKNKFDKNIIGIFQPHQTRRLLEFYEGFVESLSTIDKVLIYDIYTARESLSELQKEFTNLSKELKNMQSVEELGKKLANQLQGDYYSEFENLSAQLKDFGKENVIILFSAGDLDYLIRKKYFDKKN